MSGGRDLATARRAKIVGIVIASTMVLWLVGQEIAGQYGWAPRIVALMDFAALAGFFWALVVTFQIWRSRRTE